MRIGRGHAISVSWFPSAEIVMGGRPSNGSHGSMNAKDDDGSITDFGKEKG